MSCDYEHKNIYWSTDQKNQQLPWYCYSQNSNQLSPFADIFNFSCIM